MAANSQWSDPAESYQDGTAITPSDVADIPLTRAIVVGASGTLRVTMRGGTVLNFAVVTAGVQYRLAVTRVHATGTSATGIVALY